MNGQDVGSSLVGQNFSSPAYFHPRPSAAGADGYDGERVVVARTSDRPARRSPTASRPTCDQVRQENNLAADAKVPVDAVTASGSGLDPHISPAYADLQVARVAQERGAEEDQVRQLVRPDTRTAATFGVLGEPRVNVLRLNIALDEKYGAPPQPAATATGG